MLAACAIGEIRVWNSASGKLLRRIEAKHAAWGPRLAWLPDSKTIAISTGEDQGGWRLWDVVAGRPASDVVKYAPHIFGFSLAEGGKMLSICDSRIGLFDVPTRTLKREIESSAWAESAAWSRGSRELAVTGDDTAVWSNNKHRGLALLPTANWYGAHWLPSGDAILSAVGGHANLFSRRAQHWDAAHLQIEIGGYGGNDTAALSRDGKRLACSSNTINAEDAGKRRVEIWDIDTSKRLAQTEPLGQHIHAFAW